MQICNDADIKAKSMVGVVDSMVQSTTVHALSRKKLKISPGKMHVEDFCNLKERCVSAAAPPP